MKYFLYLLLSVFFSHTLHAQPNSIINAKDSRFPGGIAVLEINIELQEPVAHFKSLSVTIEPQQKSGNQWKIFVPIPINTPVGTHYVNIKGQQKWIKVPFNILTYDYPEERIVSKKKTFFEPSKKLLKRIISERDRIRRILSTSANYNNDFTHFKWPIKGRITSHYGVKRIYNDVPKTPHKGIDIAGKIGTPIHAPANGIVVFSGNLYYTGKTIIIDHGKGIKTIYAHMSKTLVNLGDSVTKETVIGKVGSTGRSTGPHLHWGVYLWSVAVDPLNFKIQ